jgi:hypothetical protein
MDDELLARAASLVGVVLAGKDKRVLDARAIDLDERVLGVLLDDREEIAEQACLGLAEFDRGIRAWRRDRARGRTRAPATLKLYRVYATCSLLGSRYCNPSCSCCW